MKWYINQRIVAIVSHEQGAFKKGDEFVINGIKKNPCCGLIILDIGKKHWTNFTMCSCGKDNIADDTWWFDEKRFAPLEEKEDTIELSEVLVDENGIVQKELITN